MQTRRGKLYKKVYVLAQKLKSPPDISAALLGLGNTARTQQDYIAALAFYEQAATVAPDSTSKLQAQLNQLSLLIDQQQWSAAQNLSPQIEPEITNLPPSRTTIYAQINFAQSLMELGARRERGELRELREQKTRETKQFKIQNSQLLLPQPPQPPQPPQLSSSPLYIAQILAMAVNQAKSLGDQQAEAYAVGNLGKLYEQKGQLSIAQDLTQQALSLALATNASDIAYNWQ